jgi:hypothetical protein
MGVENMTGAEACVMEMPDTMARPLELRLVMPEPAQPAYKSRQQLVSEMWQMADRYIQQSGLDHAVLKCQDDTIVMTNAPFAGSVPICAITEGQVVPYF